MNDLRPALGSGELEILEHLAADARHVLELRPGGHWTTPSTPIFEGGMPRWWATGRALDRLRTLGFLRLRVGPRPVGGADFPELELTTAGLAAAAELGIPIS